MLDFFDSLRRVREHLSRAVLKDCGPVRSISALPSV